MTLVLDNVRNPDNFGALVRAAAAVGCQKVIATSGCVDAWQSKVLRGAAGAHFRIRIEVKKRWHEIEEFLPADRQVVVCDKQPNSRDEMDESPPRLNSHDFASTAPTTELASAQQLTDLMKECQSYKYVWKYASEFVCK